jgi:integrase/recombinase XerD
VALDVGDVNMKSGAVIVKHGKGDKRRVAFLSAKTRRELLRYLRHREDAAPTSPLFATLDGRRLTYSGLRQVVRRRADAAGIAEPGLHSFRRAFALMSLRAGMDVYSLQRIMGHSDLSVLRRYLAQTEGDLAAAHAHASPVDRL